MSSRPLLTLHLFEEVFYLCIVAVVYTHGNSFPSGRGYGIELFRRWCRERCVACLFRSAGHINCATVAAERDCDSTPCSSACSCHDCDWLAAHQLTPNRRFATTRMFQPRRSTILRYVHMSSTVHECTVPGYDDVVLSLNGAARTCLKQRGCQLAPSRPRGAHIRPLRPSNHLYTHWSAPAAKCAFTRSATCSTRPHANIASTRRLLRFAMSSSVNPRRCQLFV